MTHTFLLEIGLEEMPDNAIQSAENQLVDKTKSFLDDHHLSYGEVYGFSTPRRFSVMVKDLEERQADESLIVRGPAKRIAQDEDGNWTKAAIGFSKGQGADLKDLVIKEDKGEPYLYVEKFIPGKESKEILTELSDVIKNIEFPKLMKWGNTNYHYVRPIHWILSLLDDQVIPISVFDVKSSKYSYGHRFLGGKIEINDPSEYEEKLKKDYVIVDRQLRQDRIVEQINKICDKNNWTVPNLYSDLLEEVTNLVEYPTAFAGSFDENYLELPTIVLETSMIDHQRYFSVWSKDQKLLLNRFISVRNGNDQHLENVSKGNEKVLSARLADAKFFYEEDKKLSIQDSIEKLKILDYHKDIGTIFDKQERVNHMAKELTQFFELSAEEERDLNRVTNIYKFDLVTQMVDEFTSLQGKIGAIYAKERGENENVVSAIAEQYLPVSSSGALPQSKVAKLLALLDKTDSLIQFFSANLIPTGSNDPYALRRQAMGIVRIILSFNSKQFNLIDYLEKMIQQSDLPAHRFEQLKENKESLTDFILSRLEKIMEKEYQIPHDLRQATLAMEDKSIVEILNHAKTLKVKKETEDFKEFIDSITRVLNITKDYQSKNNYKSEFIETESERKLAEASDQLTNEFYKFERSEEQYQALKNISPLIDKFFENNMIMVDNEEIKENRLTILNNIADLARSYADFNQIII